MTKSDLPERVYLDACVLIDIIEGTGSATVVRSVLQHIDGGRIELVASTLLLVEVRPNRVGGRSDARKVVRELLLAPRTILIDVDQTVVMRAAELADEHSLTTCDAIHLATALVGRADVLFTRDGQFPFSELDSLVVTKPYDVDHPPGTLYTTENMVDIRSTGTP